MSNVKKKRSRTQQSLHELTDEKPSHLGRVELSFGLSRLDESNPRETQEERADEAVSPTRMYAT